MEKKTDKNGSFFRTKIRYCGEKQGLSTERNNPLIQKRKKAYYFFRIFNSLKTSLKLFPHSTIYSGKCISLNFCEKNTPFSYSTSFPHSPQSFPQTGGKNLSPLLCTQILHIKSPGGKTVENASYLSLWNVSTFPASLLLILN